MFERRFTLKLLALFILFLLLACSASSAANREDLKGAFNKLKTMEDELRNAEYKTVSKEYKSEEYEVRLSHFYITDGIISSFKVTWSPDDINGWETSIEDINTIIEVVNAQTDRDYTYALSASLPIFRCDMWIQFELRH